MLIVTVAYRPGGDPSREEVLHRLEIANVTHLADTSDYVVTHDSAAPRRRFRIVGHLRSLGALSLVRKVLDRLVETGFS